MLSSFPRTVLFLAVVCCATASTLVPVFAASTGAYLVASAWVGTASPSFGLIRDGLSCLVGLPAFMAWIWVVCIGIDRAHDAIFPDPFAGR